MAQNFLLGGPYNQSANLESFSIHGAVNDVTLAYYYLGSDISVGNWTPSAGGSLFGVLDETTASDTDYIISGVDPATDIAEIKFAGVLTPVDAYNHVLSYRIKGDNGTNIVVSVVTGQGGTIASWSHTPAPSGWTQYDQAITPGEAAAISNYPDLRLRITAG